jgi:hypothetical protein
MSREDHIFRLRIKHSIMDWLREQAPRNHRSVTAEINFILEKEMQSEASPSKK